MPTERCYNVLRLHWEVVYADMTVCFCGHSKLYSSYDSIKVKCLEIVRGLIAKGADSFLIGDYRDFDSLATSVCQIGRAHD